MSKQVISFRMEELMLKYLDEITEDYRKKSTESFNSEDYKPLYGYFPVTPDKVNRTATIESLLVDKFFKIKGLSGKVEIPFTDGDKELIESILSKFGVSIEDVTEEQIGKMLWSALGFVNLTDDDVVSSMINDAGIKIKYDNEGELE